MRKYLPILLALVIGLTGCVTQTSNPQPPIPDGPPAPPGMVTAYSKPVVPPGQVKKFQKALAALPPLKLAPAGSVFYDDFSVIPNTNWSFYQGTRAFTNGILRMTVPSNTGMYAWPKGNWTNVSVSADIKLLTGAFGASVGVRLNTNSGANYQAWIYNNGRMTIEKYGDWFGGWQEVASGNVTAPGTTTNNVKMTMTNNVIRVYYNGTQTIVYTDTSTPLMAGGTVDLCIWGNGTTTADYDNVTVYNLDSTTVPPSPPSLVAGLTNTMGFKGLSTTLSVTVTGNPLTYRWTLPNKTTVVGTNTYTITNVQTAGTYSVSISNALGKVTSAAYLSVGTTNLLTNCIPTVTKSSVTLAWCPSAQTNGIISYKIYYGTGAITNWIPTIYATNPPPCPNGVIVQQGSNWCRCYTNVTDAGTNTFLTITNLKSGITHYFAATAYDSLGLESDFSDEVSYTVPQAGTLPPTNVVLTMTRIGNGVMQFQSKICPSEPATIWYTRSLNQKWSVLASNIVSDVYGNWFYTETPTSQMKFYKLQPQ